jgi:hypothetical protein
MHLTFLTFADLLDKWSGKDDHPNISAWLRGGGIEELGKIEDEARRAYLDELMAVGAVTTPMSYDEIKAAIERVEQSWQAARD